MFPQRRVAPPRRWRGTAVPRHRPPLLSRGGSQNVQSLGGRYLSGLWVRRGRRPTPSTFERPPVNHDATIVSRPDLSPACARHAKALIKYRYGANQDVCGDCRAVKRFLSKRNIPYEEINMEGVEGAAEIVMLVNQRRRSVPTLEIDGRFVNCSPFDRRKLSEELGIH